MYISIYSVDYILYIWVQSRMHLRVMIVFFLNVFNFFKTIFFYLVTKQVILLF